MATSGQHPALHSNVETWLEVREVLILEGLWRPVNDRIPRVVHFMKVDPDWTRFFSRDYIAVRAAAQRIKPDVILFHVVSLPPAETDNEWIKLLKEEPLVKFIVISPIESIQGKKIEKFAHVGDFLRTFALMIFGGIYMDTDAIAIKSFDPLFTQDMIMHAPGEDGMFIARLHESFEFGNGLLMTRSCSDFVLKYHNVMVREFHTNCWVCHSTKIFTDLGLITEDNKGLVLLNDQAWFPLTWREHALDFMWDNVGGNDWTGTYAIHIYGIDDRRPYLHFMNDFSLRHAQEVDSNFNRLVRDILPLPADMPAEPVGEYIYAELTLNPPVLISADAKLSEWRQPDQIYWSTLINWGFTQQYLPNNRTHLIIDAGAHAGVMSCYLGRLGYDVLAIEPSKRNFQHLKRSIKVNQLEGTVAPYNFALSNEGGKKVKIVTPNTEIGAWHAYMQPHGAEIPDDAVLVEEAVTITFDEMWFSPASWYQGRPIAILYLSIEGAEGVALSGAERLMKENPPAHIMVDLNPDNLKRYDENFYYGKVYDQISAFGYTLSSSLGNIAIFEFVGLKK